MRALFVVANYLLLLFITMTLPTSELRTCMTLMLFGFLSMTVGTAILAPALFEKICSNSLARRLFLAFSTWCHYRILQEILRRATVEFGELEKRERAEAREQREKEKLKAKKPKEKKPKEKKERRLRR